MQVLNRIRSSQCLKNVLSIVRLKYCTRKTKEHFFPIWSSQCLTNRSESHQELESRVFKHLQTCAAQCQVLDWWNPKTPSSLVLGVTKRQKGKARDLLSFKFGSERMERNARELKDDQACFWEAWSRSKDSREKKMSFQSFPPVNLK